MIKSSPSPSVSSVLILLLLALVDLEETLDPMEKIMTVAYYIMFYQGSRVRNNINKIKK